MDHTATVLLMDAKWEFAGSLDPHEGAAVFMQKLCLLVGRALSGF